MDLSAVLRQLCEVPGVSGAEGDAAAVVKTLLAAYTDDIKTDALGSVAGTVAGAGTHILLEAHLDQIGMVVTGVDSETGFVRFARCGGSDRRVLCAARVKIWGSRPLDAVITSTPPHLAEKGEENTAPAFEKMAADTGLPAAEVAALVKPGNRISVCSGYYPLLGQRVCSPFLDDRSGVLAVLRTLDIIKDTPHGCRVTALFATQEETGGSGAKAATFGIAPEEAIAVDVSFAAAPDTDEKIDCALGKGTMLGIAPGLDTGMHERLAALARINGIPLQWEVVGGNTGTDADDILVSRAGVKTALLSLPLRNMHTGAEIADLGDIEATAQLMAAYILDRGGRENA